MQFSNKCIYKSLVYSELHLKLFLEKIMLVFTWMFKRSPLKELLNKSSNEFWWYWWKNVVILFKNANTSYLKFTYFFFVTNKDGLRVNAAWVFGVIFNHNQRKTLKATSWEIIGRIFRGVLSNVFEVCFVFEISRILWLFYVKKVKKFKKNKQ